jgi:hypothetical protein
MAGCRSNNQAGILRKECKVTQAKFENITTTEAGMELPDADLKISAPGK